MKTGEGTPFQKLFDEIEQEREGLQAEASVLPRSYGEYMELPVEQRMSVATEAFRAFTPNLPEPMSYPDDGWPSRPSKYGVAWIRPEDRPETSIRGTIGYVPPDGKKRQRPSLEVYARAYLGRGGGTGSRLIFLGAVAYGPYELETEDYSEDSIWYVEGKTALERHTLDSPVGQRAVDFIDQAMDCQYSHLIAGYRDYLGTKALEGAAI